MPEEGFCPLLQEPKRFGVIVCFLSLPPFRNPFVPAFLPAVTVFVEASIQFHCKVSGHRGQCPHPLKVLKCY